METKERKATDILLSIEAKVNNLLQMYSDLSFNIKLLTSRINNITNVSNKDAPTQQSDDRKILVSSEDEIPVETSPVGFRRTSRPETFENKASSPNKDLEFNDFVREKTKNQEVTLFQRVVDKNGKALFLADVEFISELDNEVVLKTRTNGAGKWEAKLAPGNYKITIRKRQPDGKSMIEGMQSINIDGSESMINIDMLIIK